jgi:hypothetical protein
VAGFPAEKPAGGGLEERLRRLEDERSILDRLHAYGHSIDYGNEDEFVDCWTPDGVLKWPQPHQPYLGHDQIRAVFRAHTHAPEMFHKHVVVDVRISLDGDAATSDSYFMRLDDYEPGPQISSFGRYRDRLVRCPDGAWRFQERVAEREARHPLRPSSNPAFQARAQGGR